MSPPIWKTVPVDCGPGKSHCVNTVPSTSPFSSKTLKFNSDKIPLKWISSNDCIKRTKTRTFIIIILFFKNVFYESIVSLLICVNFCCIAKWLSYAYIYILFHTVFHYGLSQDTKYSSLCNTVGPCCLSILYMSEWVQVTQSCPTLCNPMDYTVHGILQARILVSLSLLQGIFPTQG